MYNLRGGHHKTRKSKVKRKKKMLDAHKELIKIQPKLGWLVWTLKFENGRGMVLIEMGKCQT